MADHPATRLPAGAVILQDGSNPLTANWDAGAFDIRARNLTADALTAGRGVFTGTDGLLSVDDAFVWDNTNKLLSIGDTTTTFDGSAFKMAVVGTKVGFAGLTAFVDNTAHAIGTGGGIIFTGKYTDGGVYANAAGIWASKVSATTGNYGFDLVFANRENGLSLIEKARILSGGNMGIGTSSPNLFGYATGNTVLTVQGTNRGVIEMASSVADGLGATIGEFIYSAASNTGGQKRLAMIQCASAGATANNRGGNLYFYTKPNNAALSAIAMTITETDRIGIGTIVPGAKCHIDQSSTSGNIPVLTVDQGDDSEGFFHFIGATAASAANPVSSWTAGNTIQGFVRVGVNGDATAPDKWVPYYDAPTS